MTKLNKQFQQMTWQRAGLLFAAVTLAGCATSKVEQTDAISERLDSYIVEDGSIVHNVQNQEIAVLWRTTEKLRLEGDYENARASLQEAIVISPNDAILWSRAAELELELNQHLRAENYAAKSNFLTAETNHTLRHRNWLIIQQAREGRGDLLGGREAQLQARNHNL